MSTVTSAGRGLRKKIVMVHVPCPRQIPTHQITPDGSTYKCVGCNRKQKVKIWWLE
jgi:hypothetical protein